MRATVLDCGYIGFELARTPVAGGHDVWGTRRSDDGLNAIEATGAETVRADVTDANSLGAVPDVDHVIFAADSGDRGADATRAVFAESPRTAIDQFAACDSPSKHLVYASNTSVYGDHGGDFVDESTPLDPTTDKMCVLTEAERVAREYTAECGVKEAITRLVGFYGPDRYRLERYLNGPTTAGYLNMVHRGDTAGVIASLLEANRARDDAVLVVDDGSVSEHEFAGWLADKCGIPCPEKHTKEERLDAGDLPAATRHRVLTSKRYSNDYPREFSYSFAYPTYREGYRAAINAYRVDDD